MSDEREIVEKTREAASYLQDLTESLDRERSLRLELARVRAMWGSSLTGNCLAGATQMFDRELREAQALRRGVRAVVYSARGVPTHIPGQSYQRDRVEALEKLQAMVLELGELQELQLGKPAAPEAQICQVRPVANPSEVKTTP